MLGLKNFYVLTRYNRSFFYALAVYQLGERVKAQMASSDAVNGNGNGNGNGNAAVPGAASQ
jgi:membrane-bound lytic murein transglycosylase B